MTTMMHGLTHLLTTDLREILKNISDTVSNDNYSNNNDRTNIVTVPVNFVQGNYPNLDKDRNVRKSLVKHYYYKILDKWLYNELKPLLAYIKIVNDVPTFVSSLNDVDTNSLKNESRDIINKKIQFFEQKIISKDLVKHILKKIVKKYSIKWYELNKYNKYVKKNFFNYIKKKIEKELPK